MNEQILIDKDLQEEMLNQRQNYSSAWSKKATEALNRDSRQRVGKTQERWGSFIEIVAQPIMSLGSSE